MSTKSKSSLLTIILLALAFFISAIIWKNTRIDNSEEVFIEPVIKSKTIVKRKNTPVIESPTIQNTGPLSEVDRKLAVKAGEKRMGMYIKYKTPEQIMEAVSTLEKLGRHDEADEHIQMLIERFPDFEI